MPNQFLSPEGDLENYFVTEYWLIDQYIGDQLWTWGRAIYGELGTNDTINRIVPITTFAGGTNWKQVSCGGYGHTAAIKTDGTLWIWGNGVYGQLGNNITANVSTPVTTFAGGTNWKQVSCGGPHTAAIKTDGTLWVWGNNVGGQLGTNNIITRSTPVTTFAGGTNWKQVSCGGQHTAAIKTDGTLWGSGSALVFGGILGTNDTITRSTPVTTFAGGTNWKQVSCGGACTAAIKTDGTLWVWGFNSSGQLGTNDNIGRNTPVTTFAGGNNWKQVSTSPNNTAAIKTNGTLWTWGSGTFNQLGTSNTITRSTPVTTLAGGTNWKQVSMGIYHAGAIKTDGTLWAWGRANSGQLGTNDTFNRDVPVTTFAGKTNWKQISFGYHSAAVTTGITPDLPLS